MATDWEEVKRLAADLQRAQDTQASHRLSERNCIEVVKKLLDSNLLEIYFTSDGKEYITPQHLLREIKDELCVRRGRVNITELSSILNVDYTHVETKASDLVRSDKTCHLVLGELINNDYLKQLAEDIDDHLQLSGVVTINELTKQYDLPPEFLQKVIDTRLGTIIHGQRDASDKRVLYTDSYVNRHKAVIRGALMAVTRPTPVATVINQFGLQERLFHSVLDELVKLGQLKGFVSGGRSERAIYIPDVYTRTQNEWVESFYKQNGYLECDALIRIGIGDGVNYIKQKFKQENITYLKTCAISQRLLEQIESSLEEALSSSAWADLVPLVPSVLSTEDIQQLLEMLLKSRSSISIFCQTMAVSDRLLQGLVKPFEAVMETKAKQVAQKGFNLTTDSGKGEPASADTKQARKEERRKKATGGKSGGGTQGRETRTKAVKKKYRAGKGDEESDSDNETTTTENTTGGPLGKGQIPFLSIPEIEEIIKQDPLIEDCPDDLITELASHLHRPLTKKFQEIAKSVFLTSTGSGQAMKKSHAEVQDKINGLLTNIHLFAKAIEVFGEDMQNQLSRHLLKTLCSDVVNIVFSFIAQENMIQLDQDSFLTPEMRVKVLQKFPEKIRDPVSKLNASLNGKSVGDFYTAVETATGPAVCDMIIRKIDKKKERQQAFSHRQALLQQLSETLEPALALHLSALILFQTFTHTMLHASGKFVPQILSYLENQVPADCFQLLQQYQNLVIKHLTLNSDDPQISEVKKELEAQLPKIKEAAISTKKTSTSAANDDK